MKIIYGVLFAVIYTTVYFFLAFFSTGGGHGNFIVLLPLTTWLFNFVALFLLARLDSRTIRIFFVVMMLVYYTFNLFILYPALSDIHMVTYPHAEGILIPAVWYLLGQLILWTVFFKEVLNQKHKS
jgi:hypothetical protein